MRDGRDVEDSLGEAREKREAVAVLFYNDITLFVFIDIVVSVVFVRTTVKRVNQMIIEMWK